MFLPGSSDGQLAQSDGSVIGNADYRSRTDHGVDFHVKNMGNIYQPHESEPRYLWTAPTFEAPIGKYGWLNDAIFVSTLTPAGDKDPPAVRVTSDK